MLSQNPNPIGALVWNRGDLPRGLEHPAFTPGVHDSIRRGILRQERQRDFDNNRVHVFSGAIVFAAVNETVIAFLVLLEPGPVPAPWPGREILLLRVSQLRIGRVEIKKIVAFE